MTLVALLPPLLGSVAFFVLYTRTQRRRRAAQIARKSEESLRREVPSRRVTPRGTRPTRRRPRR